MTTALGVAQRVGSANGVMLAALGLADYFVWRRQERQAREHSEIAYSVAQATEGAYLIACVVDAIAAILLRTSEWEYAATILREAPLPAAPYYAMRSASFEAQVLLRQGDDRTATDLLTQAAREAERMHQFRSLAMILPDLALAQLRRGHPETALSKAREAKEIVWRFGSASMQRLARERLKFLNVR
ncbi:MAG: hypothetical protein JO060_05435 [Candidatus Eremiobacteraeota bacterium]|nr:hypothetical protein [Candidatus Eremiobacteraeota bacterium]